ncbi:MAG: class I SAM-dependent methyltransferase [Alphaproteobacteria bacterium]|nr:class I SAM-dependent methyltransferase [Alphaproteobacteria bacterium]
MKSADWDRLADEFESETCDITREESAAQMARFVRLAKLPKNGAVLADLGCGVGSFIARFGKRFETIHGVEFAPRIIARAKARCGDGVAWLTTDIPRAARRIGRAADLTVCLNVITQPREKDRDKLWAAVAAVTKRGGSALMVVPSLESERMVVARGGEQKWRAGGLVERDGVWQKHYERAELAEIFKRHGFTPTRIGRAHYPWSVEGMRARKGMKPWDWIALAKRA